MNIHYQNLTGNNCDPAVPPHEAVLGNGQKKQHNHQLVSRIGLFLSFL